VRSHCARPNSKLSPGQRRPRSARLGRRVLIAPGLEHPDDSADQEDHGCTLRRGSISVHASPERPRPAMARRKKSGDLGAGGRTELRPRAHLRRSVQREIQRKGNPCRGDAHSKGTLG
jgi:hypothetical protein